jgi:cation transport protein ChaC
VIVDEQMLAILSAAQGRFGTTLAYLLETAAALREHQVHDREIERLVALARRHQLA